MAKTVMKMAPALMPMPKLTKNGNHKDTEDTVGDAKDDNSEKDKDNEEEAYAKHVVTRVDETDQLFAGVMRKLSVPHPMQQQVFKCPEWMKIK